MVQANKNQAIMHKDTYIIISLKQRDNNLPTLIFPAMQLLQQPSNVQLQTQLHRHPKTRVSCLVKTKTHARIQTATMVLD